MASLERAVSFGPFRLLPAQQLLLEGETPVRLGSRALEILIALVERAGELVTKGELMARVWPNTVVEESNVKAHVANLRRVLGDGQPGRRYLATVPGRGYRFVAPVEFSELGKPTAQPSAAVERAHSLPASQTHTLGRGPNSTPPPDEAQPMVVVIDDDRDIREALQSLLRSVGLRVELFASVQEFLDSAQPRPGCLVLDVRLPGRSGLDFHDDLVRANVHLPVVFISGHADIQMSVRAMKAGAVEFLTKPVRHQDLLDAIQTAIVHDRAHREEERTIAAIQTNFDTLSPREREVMALVVAGHLNKQIAAEIGISEATVKSNRGQVMRKMHVRSLAELIRIADKLDLIRPQSRAS
jgi:FixJ family two-component response regulator/DNA-binding winged helix-turn-helix (wHTH) protein